MDLVLLALISCGLLFVALQILDPERLHISFLRGRFNDQAGYVTMARALSETGQLRSHILYTSALWQQVGIEGHRVYMPGHAMTIAASFKLFGYGSVQAILPSLVSYTLTALCVYLTAFRLSARSRQAGWIAAFVWLAFPPALLFACSAMTELNLCCACAAAWCAFVFLPASWRPWLGPLLLCIPFMFRELSAFLVVPMVLLILEDELARNPRSGPFSLRFLALPAVSVALSVFFTSLLLFSPLCTPRVTLLPAMLLDGDTANIYGSAARQQELSQAKASVWLQGLSDNLTSNVSILVQRLWEPTPELVGEVAPQELYPLLAIAFAALALGLIAVRDPKHRATAGGAALLVALSVSFILLAYQLITHKGVRLLLFTVPLLAIALGRVLAGRLRGPVMVPLAGVPLLMLSVFCLWLDALELEGADAFDDRNRQFIEFLAHDDRTLLVAPGGLALEYLVAHYPVEHAFPPADDATLALLARHYSIGTLILPEALVDQRRVTHAALRAAAFVPIARAEMNGERLLILRNSNLPD